MGDGYRSGKVGDAKNPKVGKNGVKNAAILVEMYEDRMKQ